MLPVLTITGRCTQCDNCRLLCPEKAIFHTKNIYSIDPWTCTLCGICQEVCPTECIKLTPQPDTDLKA